MKSIGAYEAKTYLSKLLKQAAQGHYILITKNGVPLAQMIPPPRQPQTPPKEVIQQLKGFRQGKKLKGLNVREMIEKGRKF